MNNDLFKGESCKMEKILIMAYMGTGKTELESRYGNVVDFDFQDYKYIYDESIRHLPIEQRKGSTNLRTENKKYPKNFQEDAIKLLNEGKIVVSPFIEHTFRAYDSKEFKEKIKDVRVILVCPERDNFKEYVERFKARGNSDAFIERRRKEFGTLMDIFDEASSYEKIVVKPGRYLSDTLLEYGLPLKSINSEKTYKKI